MTTHEQVPEWKRRFLNVFSHRFLEIARMADKGDDNGYGKGLANLEIDTEQFIHSTLQELVKAIVERKEYREHHEWDGWDKDEKIEYIVTLEDLLTVAKEQFGVSIDETLTSSEK